MQKYRLVFALVLIASIAVAYCIGYEAEREHVESMICQRVDELVLENNKKNGEDAKIVGAINAVSPLLLDVAN